MTFGPSICTALKKSYPDRVGCQGVGGGYTAQVQDNMQPKGTSAAAIEEGIKMFTTANAKCPKAVVTFGGYRYTGYTPRRVAFNAC
jgi:cutinase